MSKKGYLNDISDESDGVQNPSNLPNKANLITIVPKMNYPDYLITFWAANLLFWEMILIQCVMRD